LPDIVQDGVNGLVFEPENPVDLRRCLRRFIVEPDLLERLCHTPPAVKTVDEYTGEVEDIYTEICTGPYRLRSLQRGLARQYQLSTALSQENERLRAEIAEVTVQSTALRSEQDRLQVDKCRIEQERDRALAEVETLKGTLADCEQQLGECRTRLEAIYTSTTWKLYRGYAAVRRFLASAVLGFLGGRRDKEKVT
jgi:chromosome segregation ATPase